MKLLNEKGEFNVLYVYEYIVTLVKLLKEFKKSVINNYKEDLAWIKTLDILKNNVGEDTTKILFKRGSNGFI